MIENLSGSWQGLLQDVEGFSARGNLTLRDQGELNGEFSYQPTGDHCPGPEQKGEIHGRADPRGAVLIETKLADGGSIRFEGRQYEVRHHARAAICGTYSIDGGEQQGSRGGTAIFWLFEDKY